MDPSLIWRNKSIKKYELYVRTLIPPFSRFKIRYSVQLMALKNMPPKNRRIIFY